MADTITADTASPTGAAERPPFWRDVRVLRVLAQIAAIIIVGLTLRWLVNNLINGLNDKSIPTTFDFLDRPAGFAVRDSPFDPESPIRQLIWVGIRNTAMVSVVGIGLALFLGTLVGIGRLSTNWIVRKLATIYVETFRNIPILVIIIFFGFALFTFGPLPAFNPSSPPNEVQIPGTDTTIFLLSKSRIGLPSIARDGTTLFFWILVIVAFVIAALVWTWRTRLNSRTGAPHHRVLWSLGVFIVLVLIAFWATDTPLRWSLPRVSDSGRRIVDGLSTNDAYVALTLALGVYTASHIAEIIRGSILAVHKGQTEAANALALTGFQRYRYVILPQAFRIALPPIINQFLNLVKNSSLATAVAYPDITALVKTAIGNGNPAPQLILILMAVYLSFSLFISLILNIVNRRFQLVGR